MNAMPATAMPFTVSATRLMATGVLPSTRYTGAAR
jgi:hypothetical protein